MSEDYDLVLTRTFDAPPEKVYRAWTEPELLKQWFAPKPFTTPAAELDLRVGGANRITMADPDGNQFPNDGVYLELVPGRKLVFTDAFSEGWKPAAKPFMTAVLTFEPTADGKTLYTAVARHASAEDMKAHEEMGFHAGWGQCADQLAELLKTF